jgi:hypothetical protein
MKYTFRLSNVQRSDVGNNNRWPTKLALKNLNEFRIGKWLRNEIG